MTGKSRAAPLDRDPNGAQQEKDLNRISDVRPSTAAPQARDLKNSSLCIRHCTKSVLHVRYPR